MMGLILFCAGAYILISLVSHILNIYRFFIEDKDDEVETEKTKLEE